MTEAAALLDARKKRKVEERASPPPSKRSAPTSSSRHGDSSSSMSRISHRSVREEGGGHRERGKERRARSRSHSRERERESGGARKSVRYVRKEEKSKRRSASPSFEEDFGVSKETLLHGSYADYIKEYSARSTRGSGNLGQSSSGHQPQQTPAMLANLAAAYQKALTQFTTKLAQQDPSKMPPMDPKTYSRLVEDFLSKTQGNKSSHR